MLYFFDEYVAFDPQLCKNETSSSFLMTLVEWRRFSPSEQAQISDSLKVPPYNVVVEQLWPHDKKIKLQHNNMQNAHTRYCINKNLRNNVCLNC